MAAIHQYHDDATLEEPDAPTVGERNDEHGCEAGDKSFAATGTVTPAVDFEVGLGGNHHKNRDDLLSLEESRYEGDVPRRSRERRQVGLRDHCGLDSLQEGC